MASSAKITPQEIAEQLRHILSEAKNLEYSKNPADAWAKKAIRDGDDFNAEHMGL